MCGPPATYNAGGGCVWGPDLVGCPRWLPYTGAVGAGFGGDSAGAAGHRDSSGGVGFPQSGIGVPRVSIPKGETESCSFLKALLQRYPVSLLPNPFGQSDSQSQPKFTVERPWLTGHHF